MDNINRTRTVINPQMFLISVAGILTVLLGLSVIIGWHTHTELLIQVFPNYVPMQYNTALGFIICGLGLLTCLYGHSRLTRICGALVLGLSTLTLIEYIIDTNLGLDQMFMEHYITVKTFHPGRMAQSTALSFFLSGTTLLIICSTSTLQLQNRTLLLGILSSAIFTIGVGILVGYIGGTDTPYGWEHLSQMAIHTATGFLIFGAGLLAYSYHEITKTQSLSQQWLALTAGISVTTLTVVLWIILNSQERAQITWATDSHASHNATTIHETLTSRIQGLIRMANRMAVQPIAFEEWEDDAELYVQHQPGLQAISWIDPSMHVRWIVPLEGNEAAKNLDLAFEERRLNALKTARDQRKVMLTRTINFVQGDRGFIIYAPIFQGNKFGGFIGGVFSIDNFFKNIPGHDFMDDFNFRILDGDEEIFNHNSLDGITNNEWINEKEISVQNITWQLQSWPNARMLSNAQSPTPDVALIVGIFLATLLALVISKTQVVRENSKILEESNKDLENEITIRKNTEEELKKHRNHLEELVNERTYKLKEINKELKYENTTRKFTEKNLRASEARNRVLTDFAPAGIFRTTADGNYIYVNEKYTALSGLELSEATDSGWTKAIHPDDLEWLNNKWNDAIENQRPFEAEFRFLQPDGKTVWCQCNTAIETDNEKIIGYIGTLTDITQRMLVTEALQESKQRLYAIINNAVDGIITTNESGIIESANLAAQKIYACSENQLIGTDFSLLIHDREREKFKQVITEYKAEGSSYAIGTGSRIIAACRADGTEFPMDASIDEMLLGKKRKLILIVRDVSDLQQAQIGLKQSHEQLRELTKHIESVREEERKVIARDIHDDLGQVLTALSTDVHWMISHCSKNQYDLEEKASSMLPTIESAIQSVQRIVSELRPPLLDDLGLASAIMWYCEQFQNRTGITCKPEIKLFDFHISTECSTAIFRILQESLTNIARHSGASNVEITLGTINTAFSMVICDDGKGISNDEIYANNAFGLIGMRERALSFGGNLEIRRRIDHGTYVNLILPDCGAISTLETYERMPS